MMLTVDSYLMGSGETMMANQMMAGKTVDSSVMENHHNMVKCQSEPVAVQHFAAGMSVDST